MITNVFNLGYGSGLQLGYKYAAVSYTHLEEKERQDLQLEIPWYQVGSGTKTYMAVSYTHLDVYKRQAGSNDHESFHGKMDHSLFQNILSANV